MTKVMILGDSYINRLQDFTDKGCPNLKLATSDIRVRFAGKSGGNVSSMQRELVPQAFVYKPEIIFMHIINLGSLRWLQMVFTSMHLDLKICK